MEEVSVLKADTKNTKIIVDPGSCHMGKKEYAKELIDLAVDNGCWAIKFQLFKDMQPNIELPREWWPELVEHAKGRIEIFASVFDREAIELLKTHGAKYVKFSYQQQFKLTEKEYQHRLNMCDFAQVIRSCMILTVHYRLQDIRLYCSPMYPAPDNIAFDYIFKKYPYSGFSDHTLGYQSTLRAIEAGAEYIEKHINLDHKDINVPDAEFALKPKQLRRMMNAIRSNRERTLTTS